MLAVGPAPPGLVAAGAERPAGELLVRPGVVLLAGAVAAGPVVLAGGDGAGRAGASPPLAPPPNVVPWPGLPWTTADSGLPAACSTTVTATAQPMNAATASAAARPSAEPGCPGRARRRRPG
jgi:hypothetical protein